MLARYNVSTNALAYVGITMGPYSGKYLKRMLLNMGNTTETNMLTNNNNVIITGYMFDSALGYLYLTSGSGDLVRIQYLGGILTENST